jgi:hypothetical protein
MLKYIKINSDIIDLIGKGGKNNQIKASLPIAFWSIFAHLQN